MNKDDLEKIRNKYQELKERKESFEKLLIRKRKLETNPKVKEYLEIQKQVGSLNSFPIKNDLDMINLAIDNVKINDLNNIYVYYGTYSEDYNSKPFLIEKDSPYAKYRIYANIERPLDTALKEIPIAWANEFEKRNIVLYPNNDLDFKNYYTNIKLLYFNTAINLGIDEALELIKVKSLRQKEKKIEKD